MIEIEVHGLTELIAKFQTSGNRLSELVARELMRLALMGQAKSVSKVHGGNPLHSRTGNLSRAIVESVGVTQDGSTIVGFWGVSKLAPYGKIHEYGGTFTIGEHMRTSRLGNTFSVRSHQATYPERSFLRSALHEMESAGTIRDRLAAAAAEAIRG